MLDGIDSIRIVNSSMDSNTVQGWGTLNIQGTTFNTLQIQITREVTNSVYHLVDEEWEFQSEELQEPSVRYLFIDSEIGEMVATASSLDEGKGGYWSYLTYLIDSDVTTSIKMQSTNFYRLFPNPASNQAVLYGLENGDLVSVYDLSGRLLVEEKVSANQHTIITSGLDNGMYTVRVSRKNSFGTLRLVVTH